MRYIVIALAGLMIGIFTGPGLAKNAYTSPSSDEIPPSGVDYRIMYGVITDHDPKAKTVIMKVNWGLPDLPATIASIPMRFSYDKKTIWTYSAFIKDAGSIAYRRNQHIVTDLNAVPINNANAWVFRDNRQPSAMHLTSIHLLDT